MLQLLRSLGRGSRIPPRSKYLLLFELQIGSCWLLFRTFSHCFRLLEASSLFSSNFWGLGSFFDGLGTVLEGGWAILGRFFRRFFVFSPRMVISSKSLFYCGKNTIFKLPSLEKIPKTNKNPPKKPMRFWNGKN